MVVLGRVSGYKSSDVQLLLSTTSKHSVGGLPGSSIHWLYATCGLLYFHTVVERTPTICHCDEASDWPLLALPMKQCCQHQEFQPSCRREDNGVCVTASERGWRYVYRILQNLCNSQASWFVWLPNKVATGKYPFVYIATPNYTLVSLIGMYTCYQEWIMGEGRECRTTYIGLMLSLRKVTWHPAKRTWSNFE